LKKREKRFQKKIRSGGKSFVRTFLHGCHFPDFPCGEITIECISTVKHCTTATKKSPMIKMGGKGEIKNEISAQKRKKKKRKKTPILLWREGEI